MEKVREGYRKLEKVRRGRLENVRKRRFGRS